MFIMLLVQYGKNNSSEKWTEIHISVLPGCQMTYMLAKIGRLSYF